MIAPPPPSYPILSFPFLYESNLSHTHSCRKKKIVSSLLNTPKYKYKLKWNVPLLDVQFVEYGAGVSVAADKYGTTTTYSDKGWFD